MRKKKSHRRPRRLHSRRDVKTSHDMRDVCKCFRNKVHFVNALSSGPHVTDLGKGPLREVDLVVCARGSVSRTIREKCRSQLAESVGQVLVTAERVQKRTTLPSRLSLDGDPEHARCSTMRRVACVPREWMHISATKLCALLGLV